MAFFVLDGRLEYQEGILVTLPSGLVTVLEMMWKWKWKWYHMGCVILENMRNRGACKPDTKSFLYNTWPPIFSLFFKRIWIDLFNKPCLPCERLSEIDKISLWTFWILYELYRDLYLVVWYLNAKKKYMPKGVSRTPPPDCASF